ncbi:MAG: hypothetical protein ICV83_08170 [Cytophagales bacterium]|nr:hypothetical protein [Cytophagales bacterium]
MKNILPLLLLCLAAILGVPGRAAAQSVKTSTVDVKVGLGASFLGSGDLLVGKLEGELTKKWNRFLSNSVALNLGYGDDEWYSDYPWQRTFTTHLDGNVFLSPFGNHHRYNLKLGTGLSLMYVADSYLAGDQGFLGRRPDRRASLGYSLIVEQEIAVGKRGLFGLKTMIQPYLNGDIATSVMLKVGRKL